MYEILLIDWQTNRLKYTIEEYVRELKRLSRKLIAKSWGFSKNQRSTAHK